MGPDTTFEELNQTISGATNRANPVTIELICAMPILFQDEILIDERYFVLKPANGFDNCTLDGQKMTRFFRAGALGGFSPSYNVKFVDLEFTRGFDEGILGSGSGQGLGGAIFLSAPGTASALNDYVADFTRCDFTDNEAIGAGSVRHSIF